MIDKYYNGVVEQVYNHVGKIEKNIVMASYNNDFSIENLETVKRYRTQEDSVFLLRVSLDTGNWQGHMILFWKQSATCFANMAPTVLMRLWNLAGSMNFIGKSCAAIMRTEDVSEMRMFCSMRSLMNRNV